MYGIFTYIWLIFMVNVGKYTIHGWYGILHTQEFQIRFFHFLLGLVGISENMNCHKSTCTKNYQEVVYDGNPRCPHPQCHGFLPGNKALFSGFFSPSLSLISSWVYTNITTDVCHCSFYSAKEQQKCHCYWEGFGILNYTLYYHDRTRDIQTPAEKE